MIDSAPVTDGATVTIAIPTLNRGRILLETIEALRRLDRSPAEILVADQTPTHAADVEEQLRTLDAGGTIRWIRLAEPSIPHAMNVLLEAARTPLVLFLDDDVIPDPGITGAHATAHERAGVWAVAGQVLQPGESPQQETGNDYSLSFAFNSTSAQFVANVMAGNLSVKRDLALGIGGFDENFVGAAYRFETDFALRLVGQGGRIWFEPAATLRHLQLSSGGLRTYGDHRTAAVPSHSVGDYYFGLHHSSSFAAHVARRLRRNVATGFLLRHPWWIPPKLIGELRGLSLALKLYRKGRRLAGVPQGDQR